MVLRAIGGFLARTVIPTSDVILTTLSTTGVKSKGTQGDTVLKSKEEEVVDSVAKILVLVMIRRLLLVVVHEGRVRVEILLVDFHTSTINRPLMIGNVLVIFNVIRKKIFVAIVISDTANG